MILINYTINIMEPETQSEAPGCWSIASSTVMDTKSEPPGYLTDKQELKKRHKQPAASSIKVSLSSSSSVVSAQRSVITTSSRNSLKLDRKLSASHNMGGSRQTKNSRNVASSKKKEHSVASKATSQRSSRNHSSKSSSCSTSSSKKSSMQLALLPKSTCIDPPTYDCFGFHDSTTGANTKSAMSSLYSSTITNSEDVTDKGTQLDTIESESESDSDVYYIEEYDEEDSSYTKESEFPSEVGQELVVRAASVSTDSDEYALVEYEENSVQYDEEVGRAIVPAKSRYLAAAVDNYGAMVPLNSDVYENFDHTFVSCPEILRFRFLYTFLKKNLDKKIMIFFSTTDSALFHSKLLGRFHIPVFSMHSRQKREKFINTFLKFSDLEEGILCTTDAAGKDLDIPPSVDYVLQFEAPNDPSEYIMRIARISCDSDRIGRSLLFLNPGETGFLKYYDAAAIPVNEFEMPRLADIQRNIESKVNEDERMLHCAKNAYGSYLLAHASHGYRDIYNVHDLNKADVAVAFGLTSIPGDDDEEEDSTYYAGRSGSPTLEKPKQKDWMRGMKKTWPHSRVKVHPTFKKEQPQVDNSISSQMKSESSYV